MDTSATEGLKPLRADAERNRARLVEAALEMFALRGLSVSLEDIAAHAGVGVGTLYRRFGERDALIGAVYHNRVEHFVAYAERAAALPDAWEALVAFVNSAGESFARNRGLAEVLTARSGRVGFMTGSARIESCIRAVHARARAEGAIRQDVEAEDLAVLLQMVAMAVQLVDDSAPGAWRRYIELMLDSIREGGHVPLASPPLTAEQFRRMNGSDEH